MKSLSILHISHLSSVVQKINWSFWLVLFLVHPFYLSSIFGVGSEGVVIKEEPEETIAIKQESQESEDIHSVKEEPIEVISKKLPTSDIYEQLWEKVQKDENLSKIKEIIEQYSVDLHRKNYEGKTVFHIALQSRAIAIVKYLLSYVYRHHTLAGFPAFLEIVDNTGRMVIDDLLHFALYWVEDKSFLHFLFGKLLVNSTKDNILHVLVRGVQDKGFIQSLMKKFKEVNLSIDEVNKDRYTPLMLAVRHGNLVAIDALIEGGSLLITNLEKVNILHYAALEIKDTTVLEHLINKCKEVGVSVDSLNHKGHTPLMVSVCAGNLAAANALLKANAKLDVPNENKQTVLHFAAAYSSDKDFIQTLVKRFKEEGLSIDKVNQRGYTPLMIALGNGNLSAIDALIDGRAGLTLLDNTGNILHFAATYIKDEKTLQHLIATLKIRGHSLIINQMNCKQQTPLMLAVLYGNLNAVDALIKNGASLILNLNKDNVFHRRSILHFAIVINLDKTILEGLINACKKAGSSIDHVEGVQNCDCSTPLMAAARQGNLTAAKILLKANAKLDILDVDRKNALHHATYSEDKASLEFFIEKFKEAKINIDQTDQAGHTPLIDALVNCNTVAIDVLIAGGASLIPSSPNGNIGNNLLHLAVQLVEAQPILQYLINKVTKKGQSRNIIDINQTNNFGYTPLMMSALAENVSASEILVKAGAKLDILTQNKNNALHLAAAFVKDKNFFQPFIRLFQQSKSQHIKEQVNQKNQHGCTPLIIALLNGNIIAAQELIKANAKLDILTPIQNSILHIAVSRIKDRDFLQFLIKKCKDAKLNINQMNQKGFTPLTTAVFNSNQEAIGELIKAKADLIDPEPNADKSMLHFAAKYGKDKATVQYLINKYKEEGLDINPRDQKGYTPLMMAVKKGNQEAIDAFIESGATVAVSSGIGNILHFAAMHVKDKTLFQHLMNKCKELGLIDIYQANEKGHTPFMLAASNINLAVIEAFMEINAKLNLNIIQENDLHSVVYHLKDKVFIKNLIQKFKEANLSIDTINKNGHTPLMVAVYVHNLGAAEALIEANAQLHLLTKENENVLHIAAAYVKDKAFMEFLINAFKKANDSIASSDEEHVRAAEYKLMKKNLDINLMNQYKETALMVAVLNGNLTAIDALIEGGITVFVPTENTENIVNFANRSVNSKKMIEHLRAKCNEANLLDIHPASL